MPGKQLELSRRSAFFADPFFADLHSGLGDGVENRLAELSARTLGLTGAGRIEAAHNIQVSASNDKFQIQLELPGFAAEDFSLKTKADLIIVEAVHEAKNEDGSSKMRKFSKQFKMPAGVVTEKLVSTYSGEGILSVEAPRVISAPEGAEVSDAMKAQSQAYVTDDGVAVKKDDKASSQSIAATTKSDDGSTLSSFKSSSSSSSSSTMMSSGGSIPSSMMSLKGMSDMPSMGGMSSLAMDDPMDNMMSNMSMKSSSSKMVSSLSSKMMSSSMGGVGMDMPALNIDDVPQLPSLSEKNHKVQKTANYKPPTPASADTSVLLKYKEGSDFKLALNMQQFSPEDISIKLNGNELIIEAASSNEQFHQKHQIPENIDLEDMESSFSQDGVLVIKAPKKN